MLVAFLVILAVGSVVAAATAFFYMSERQRRGETCGRSLFASDFLPGVLYVLSLALITIGGGSAIESSAKAEADEMLIGVAMFGAGFVVLGVAVIGTLMRCAATRIVDALDAQVRHRAAGNGQADDVKRRAAAMARRTEAAPSASREARSARAR